MNILVTNDDGIDAPGLRHLTDTLREFASLKVVAPTYAQSGMSHAITVRIPLRAEKSKIFGEDIPTYKLNGTPVDCVKFGLDMFYSEKLPDMVISGINHGSNASVNLFYSGTVAAALEGAMQGINSIAFSLDDLSKNADFSLSDYIVKKVTQKIIKNPLPKRTFLNINIPKISQKELKGIKICRQSNSLWKEGFEEKIDPIGQKYYWLKGDFVDIDKDINTDYTSLTNKYVAITPLKIDITDYELMEKLEKIDF